MFFVYIDFTNCGIPYYVGKGNLRRIKLLSRARENSKHERISNKYGQLRKIILATASESLAHAFEIQFIADLHTYKGDPLAGRWACNLTRGGEGASGAKRTNETRQKLSTAAKGERNPFYGKHHSIETILKLSAINKGKTLSCETRTKISVSNAGEKNAFYGKHHSPETCAKISASLIARRACLVLDKVG